MSTYSPVASQTLSASASSVTFSNIPQDYTDLVIVCNAISNTVANYELTFNSDSGTNYSRTYLLGNGTSASSGRASNQNFFRCDQGGNLDTTWGNPLIVNVMNYSNATTYKSVLSRSGGASSGVGAVVGLWRNTAAITSLSFACSGATFSSGSTFSLYGIQAGTPKAQGGQIVTTDGTYWYHAFRASGTFTPSTAITADILVVAGGGGGGSDAGGGGGAGGLLYSASQSLSANTTYSCVIGAGGTAATTATIGNYGSNSQFGSITASVGGGAGSTTVSPAGTGGSGGGGGRNNGQAGGSPTSGQGYAGGSGVLNTNGGGGGGAGAVGSNGSGGTAGSGGTGVNTYSTWATATNTGASGYFAGGGGAGASSGGTAGTGGNGGGGNGGLGNPGNGTSGTANTGGGGGGGGGSFGVSTNGAAGGSGIVIIRYSV